MESGIYIDDQFIGITGHTVGIYFDVLRAAIDSGKSDTLTLPAEDGYITILITASTRLRAVVTPERPEDLILEVASNPFGNFPTLLRKYSHVLDDNRREFLAQTALGDALKELDDTI